MPDDISKEKATLELEEQKLNLEKLRSELSRRNQWLPFITAIVQVTVPVVGIVVSVWQFNKAQSHEAQLQAQTQTAEFQARIQVAQINADAEKFHTVMESKKAFFAKQANVIEKLMADMSDIRDGINSHTNYQHAKKDFEDEFWVRLPSVIDDPKNESKLFNAIDLFRNSMFYIEKNRLHASQTNYANLDRLWQQYHPGHPPKELTSRDEHDLLCLASRDVANQIQGVIGRSWNRASYPDSSASTETHADPPTLAH